MASSLENRHDYPVNGLICVRNIRNRLLNDDLPEFNMKNMAGSGGWKISWYHSDDGLSISPWIDSNFITPNMGVRYFFRILRKSKCIREYRDKCIFEENDAITGPEILKSDLLKEDSDLLEHGNLMIEYGIYVESIQERDTFIWKFNFNEPFYQAYNEGLYIIELCDRSWYTPRLLLKFHSPLFDNIGENKNIRPSENGVFRSKDMHRCYLIAHGVRFQFNNSVDDLLEVIRFARIQQLSNVVRYCETKIIDSTLTEKRSFVEWLKLAINYNLNHLLAEILREYTAPRKIMKGLTVKTIEKSLKIEKMSGETMKIIVSRLFRI